MTALLAVAMSIVWSAGPALAQAAPPADQTQANAPPPSYSPEQLDKMVSRIALYPDPLLAQVLAAATFSDHIPDAAKWADEHHYLRGDELAQAITADQLPWDPSVQALLPFPSVLDTMASDMDWTQSLGDAFLAQHHDVMDAVQRMRQKAKTTAICAATVRSSSAAALTSRLIRLIRRSSGCRPTILPWCSSPRVRDSLLAARSAGVSASTSACGSVPGDGDGHALIGARTR